VPDQSMRGFLSMVERDFPDQFVRIAEPVSHEFDITAIVFELELSGRSPIVVFENVEGFEMPVVTNIAGNRRLLAGALGIASDDLPAAFQERCQNYIPVEVVSNAPWQEVVFEGNDVDLTRLPIPFHFEVDAAPYITAGQITARDPETGVDTTSFHRLMLKGKNRLGVSLHSRRRMYIYHQNAEARGENLPVAVAIGTHPFHYMGSMADSYPTEVRKYEIIGGFFGEPYRVVRCSTAGIEVAAGAEIVIEGEILADVHEPEGPFGEFTGYASYRSTENVFVAKRVSMRKDAMFHSIASGMSADHLVILGISREAEIRTTLQRSLPNVTGVHVPLNTAGALTAVIGMRKTEEGQPRQAIMTVLGTDSFVKCVVVVDDDVDIFNLSDVMWAVSTRVRAEEDIVFIPGAMGFILDPASHPETHTVTKVGVDATKPKGRDFAERLVIPDEQRARVRTIMERAGISL
jgi:UbiD family decarboxylase